MTKTVLEELKQLSTEQRNPESMNLDTMTTREILETMNREDAKIHELVDRAIPQIEQAVELIVHAFQNDGRLIYVGAGTSGRLGVLDASECPPTFGTEPFMVQGVIAGGYGALVKAVEGAEDNFEQGGKDLEIETLCKDDVVVGITASRRTPYVLGALQYAGEKGAKRVFLICNSPAEDADKYAEVVISVPVGPEVLTGSTRLKAGTATKLVLNMLTTAAMVKIGKCYENLMVDLRSGSEKLRARARKIFMELTESDYEWADAVLREARGELKTALVMHWKNITAEEARALLSRSEGHIREMKGE